MTTTNGRVKAATVLVARSNRTGSSPITGCHRESCNGTGPVGTGCANDAKAVRTRTGIHHTFGRYKVELRYSPSCRTAWARVEVQNNRSGLAEAHIHRNGRNGKAYAADLDRRKSTGYYWDWTAQVNDAGYTAKACLKDTRSSGHVACTASY